MKVISLEDHKAQRDGNDGCHRPLVVHLEVAPQVTAMTRFSSVPPSRLSFMMPEESLEYLHRVYQRCNGSISMVAVSGPGDPLAVPDTTIRTVDLVKQHYPDMRIGLKTLGIGAERFAPDLARSGVTHVELIVNGVKTDILEKLYAWIRPGQKTLKIKEAVGLLVSEQKNAVPALKYNDIEVSIDTTVYPGINTRHIGLISRRMMELGAGSIALQPYLPVPDCEVAMEEPDEDEMNRCRLAAGKYLRVVEPLLENQNRRQSTQSARPGGLNRARPSAEQPNVAVVSSNGVDIDLHLGKAGQILVYGPRQDGLPCLLEVRQAPPPGSGSKRWNQMATILSDCFALLTAQAGGAPRQVLSEHKICVMIVEDQIDPAVDLLYGGGKKNKKNKSATY